MQGIFSRPLGCVELPAGLVAEFALLENASFTRDYSDYAVGRWETLPLFNRDGDMRSSLSHEYHGAGHWTANAPLFPIIVGLLKATFKIEILRSARIFVAQGAGLIRLHRDYLEFESGFTRLHLVLRTNVLAMNGERSRAFHMRLGSLWYLEGREPHWAVNYATEPRYHLVCDFPAELMPEDCIQGTNLTHETEIDWRPRPPIPEEIKLLIELAVERFNSRNINRLFDIVDIIFVKYETVLTDPYELLLQFLSVDEQLRKLISERRKKFLGY
jgi:L-proline cis-4-hydroxylase